MYEWLSDTLDDKTTLITANRRLVRTLREEFGRQQIEAGNTAWRSPDIVAWPDWIGRILAEFGPSTRLNHQQSQVLWERCLRRELGDDASGVAAAVRLARDTWQRLADARVGIREVAASAQNDDHRMYAAAAGTYLAILEGEGWIDDALAGDAVLELLGREGLAIPGRVVLVGFDRETAVQVEICSALQDGGTEVVRRSVRNDSADSVTMAFENGDAEMRAAGAWARAELEVNPDARIAVVRHGLEQSADRDVRLLREGFVPGWQYAPRAHASAVNVSYGRRLSEYPAVGIALLALRWLGRDIGSREVATLLMSPFIGVGEMADRSRLELRLRDLPDRSWSPAMITSALKQRDVDSDVLKRIAALGRQRRELPQRATPAAWAELISSVLETLGWPGSTGLDSHSYQLVNRWRELLNTFARLNLVAGTMSGTQAIGRVEAIAGEVVFQPESVDAAIQLLGPLEASGLEFDAVWIAGMTATNWPAAGHPSPLVSRKLQIDNKMPDATPSDTLNYADAVLSRLLASSDRAVCSWPQTSEDGEQTISELLRQRGLDSVDPHADPNWHAVQLRTAATPVLHEDVVPALSGEKVFGGAATIEAQMTEPFAAFVQGRLGAKWLSRQAIGIPPALRGNVIHEALYRLYQDLPAIDALKALSDAEIDHQVAEAVSAAFAPHERNTDAVLLKLLQMERSRISRLIAAFVQMDRERDEFQVAGVEGKLEFEYGGLRLSLRFDRVDRFEDGSIAILDYKTGATRELMTKKGAVREPQLFVYAMAADAPVAALALVNIDSREIVLSGGGRGYTDEELWPDLIAAISEEIQSAADDFVAGDVRIDRSQSVDAARPLNVLSRFTELRHDT